MQRSPQQLAAQGMAPDRPLLNKLWSLHKRRYRLGLRLLAQDLKTSVRTLRRRLQALVEAGYLIISRRWERHVGGKRARNVYVVFWQGDAKEDTRVPHTVAKATSQPLQKSEPRADTRPRGGDLGEMSESEPPPSPLAAALAEAGLRSGQDPGARRRILAAWADRLAGDGLTVDGLEWLVGHARGRPGLLGWWLGNARCWRDVLADRGLKPKPVAMRAPGGPGLMALGCGLSSILKGVQIR